jgi:hypothetical protein
MDAMERIAASRRASLEKDEGFKIEAPAETPEPTPAPVAKEAKLEDLSLSAQIGKQLEGGQILLDEDTLSRAVVMTKVDGKEELVSASKALGQYQKGAAADVRLAEATRIVQQANQRADELVRAAQATAPAQPAAKAAEQKDASEDVKRITQEHAQALYAGDDEKAGQLLSQLIELRVAEATKGFAKGDTPSESDLVARVVPAVQQRLSVDSALTQFYSDYPEVKDDTDLQMIADRRRAEFETQGLSRPEAIARAGEEVGKKYQLGKFKTAPADVVNDGSTTREQKLAAKQGLDEPAAAAARATNAPALPQTASSVIAEMMRARQPQAA